MQIQSNNGSIFNAIDPSILQASTGNLWMAFGSFNNGIFVTELDSTTGERSPSSPLVNVANHSEIEGAALIEHGGYYYMMTNWGGCCSGIDSGYKIHMGRSTSPTGPFLDKSGVNLLAGGGTLFYEADGARIGPGHFALDELGGAGPVQLPLLRWQAGRCAGVRAEQFVLDRRCVAERRADQSRLERRDVGQLVDHHQLGGGLVPSGVGSIANFAGVASGRYAVTLDGARTVSRVNFRSASSYSIGDAAGALLTLAKMSGDAASTINVSAGSHTIAAPITTADELGVNIGPAGSSLSLGGSLAAASLQKYGYGTLRITGSGNVTGTALAHAGTVRVTGSLATGNFFSVGQIVGDQATLIVEGTGALNAARDLNIGDTGDNVNPATGTLNLRDNAAVTVGTAGAFIVGSGFTANSVAAGTVNQTGGTLTANGNFDGAFIIGGRGSSAAVGTYNLSGGAVNANTNVRVGGFGTGTVQQTGGAFTSNSFVAIGRFAGATGTWNISAGSLNVNNSGRWLLVGESGTGSLNISGSGQVTTANVIRIGHAGGAGTIALNGGTLTTLGLQRGTGTATVNFNGGVLAPTTNNASFMQGLTAAKVQAGGAMLDTSGRNIGIAQRSRMMRRSAPRSTAA